ncbi:DNA-processing protein DprA [Paenibacillus gansuensis]|uniref:DNA-processing protein DprA n=1 Tax=Paenibacillus gansuensis TaxID=306542 RepID=A0ABW5PCK3_9BACL
MVESGTKAAAIHCKSLLGERELLFGLHELPGIGWKTIRKLIQGTSSLDQLLDIGSGASPAEELGLDEVKREVLRRGFTSASIRSRLAFYEASGTQVVTVLDEAYPPLLKQTAQPPWVLYARGDIGLLQLPLLAMVGTRTPTAYGRKAAEDLSAGLARRGFGVVSGLARGIDSTAHRGALLAGGATIAVLGTGIDVAYPPENRALYAEIAARGLVLSEYPAGTPSHPGMFPQRNRIIAGLSLGTVVIEAAVRSGSLITADQALEEARDVFAVPGPISSPKSQGALALIKQGAKLVTCAEDIIEEYSSIMPQVPVQPASEAPPQLTDEENFVLQLIPLEGATLDELQAVSKLQFGHLHSLLLHLLIKKQIRQMPGSIYTLF